MGIEINEYAAELARVTIWIGELQWMIKHGMAYNTKPILQTMNQIENRDALLNDDGTEAVWPRADVIVGNPPFLGGSKMLGELGEQYVTTLRRVYKGRVPGGADLVTYWFEKARTAGVRTGLVATNSIRGGSNREVLKRITENGRIFNAWSNEPWVNEGAAVRVSIICFDHEERECEILLNNALVVGIYPDLTEISETVGLDISQAKPLIKNKGIAFEGTKKYGPFDIPGDLARQWLSLPLNPNNLPNSNVVRPWANGMDITRRPSDTWIIDFGTSLSEAEASLFEAPFEHVLQHVKPKRKDSKWWLHERPRPDMRKALTPLRRYIATSRVAKHHLFVWLDIAVLPDSRLYVIASESDVTFGILHSRIHELWSSVTCTWHGGNTPTYNATTCFETFPFPTELQPEINEAIAAAAKRLVELRDNWLNPAGASESELKKRTLTNLYNQRPTWLGNAHKELDAAVAAAYGWPADLSDDEILKRLLQLNLERSVFETAE